MKANSKLINWFSIISSKFIFRRTWDLQWFTYLLLGRQSLIPSLKIDSPILRGLPMVWEPLLKIRFNWNSVLWWNRETQSYFRSYYYCTLGQKSTNKFLRFLCHRLNITNRFFTSFTKKKFLQEIALEDQQIFYMFFTCRKIKENFLLKVTFFLKFPIFAVLDYPWPKKLDDCEPTKNGQKKIFTICTCQTLLY